MVVTPLWDTTGNHSDKSEDCYLQMGERNKTVTLFGDSFRQCSLRILMSSATLIKMTEKVTEDYVLYIEQNDFQNTVFTNLRLLLNSVPAYVKL